MSRKSDFCIINTLGINGVTHFYSSEPYGDRTSRALGAADRRVDGPRDATERTFQVRDLFSFVSKDYAFKEFCNQDMYQSEKVT